MTSTELKVSNSECVFTALSSKVVQPFSPYTVNITVEKGKVPVNFSVTLESPEKSESFSTESALIGPGQSKTVSISVAKLQSPLPYTLKIRAENQDGFKYEETVPVFPDTHVLTLFIQTDKPVYKPGETVKFRVIPLDRELKPYKDPGLQVVIKDPQGNIVKKWNEVDSTSGLFSSELTLSSEPNLGDWIIEVTTSINSKKQIQTFSVEQYVLPKFKAEVKLPPFATYKNSKIQAEVKALYTYGKGVKGEAKVTLSDSQPQYVFRGGCGHPMQPPHKVKVVKTVPIDGSAYVEFDLVKELELDPKSNYQKEVIIDAEVTETVTGKTQEASSRIKIYEHPYKIELAKPPKNYKPGFPLTLTIKVSTQDDVPVHDENPEALVITHGFAFTAEDGIWKTSIPANGLVQKTFITPSNELVFVNGIEAKYKDVKTTLHLPPKVQSSTQKYFQITPVKTEVNPGEPIVVDFQANKPLSSVSYVLYARGEIQNFGHVVNPTPSEKQMKNVAVNVLGKFGTNAILVAYAIDGEENEFIADSVEIKLKTPSLDNHVEIQTSTKEAEPGSEVAITVKSKPKSLVALRGVDQSVLVLKKDKDINMDVVEKEIQRLDDVAKQHRMWGGSSSFQVLEDAGLNCITNAKLEKQVEPVLYARESVAFGGAPRMGIMMMDDAPAAPMMMRGAAAPRMMKRAANSPMPVAIPRVRTKFPETWIWDEVKLESKTEEKLDKIVPDTLTSWIISGFAVNPEHGIGVSLEPTVMQVFRPFFVTLNKPYSVVQGETLALQILVHNYQNDEVDAKIVLVNGEKKFHFAEGNKVADFQSKTVPVKPKDVTSVKFLIVPQTFGTLKLNVTGTTPTAGDALSQGLIVKPPGKKQIGTDAILIDLNENSIFQKKMTISFPETRVQGADVIKLSIIGDIMGSAMQNLDNLLHMPCGCGEQNMISFVPDLIVLDYLKTTAVIGQSIDPKIQKKAIEYLEHGYQRELSYRHNDGSFSAFGKSDPQGSTWLTAFVVRYFISARRYITIDSQLLDAGLQFLIAKQQADGEFREHGKIIHSELKGGVESGAKCYALSAFVLITLIEAQNASLASTTSEAFKSVMNKGFEYITSIPKENKESYVLNLISYTLELAKHAKKDEFFSRMEELAWTEGDHKWWENQMSKEDEDLLKLCCSHQPWRKPTRPACVEMTAYAMLTYLARREVGKVFPIVKCLLAQRNERGGFISTQDTVLGLSALGEFAKITRSSGNNNVSIRAECGAKEIKWEVNSKNLDVLQENELPPETREIMIHAEGKGIALAQLSWSFYEEQVDQLPSFSVEAKAKQGKTDSELVIQVTAAFTRTEPEKSNMAIVEVNLPSGFEFEQDSMEDFKKKNKAVMRYDMEDGNTKVNVYFDFLSKNPTSIELLATRAFQVANPAQALVKVYDYYDTTRKAEAFYSPPALTVANISS